MSKTSFNVNISPKEVCDILRNEMNEDLVHEEYHNIESGKFIATMIYEKYYFRASNRAALIVIVDDLYGQTNLRVISTGSSQGMIFNFDWGAANDFVKIVKRILKKYIIE